MRKLALFSIPFSASIILSFYVLPSGWRIPAAVIFAAAAAILTALQERWLKGFALMALGAAIGLGMFEIHALRTTVPAHLLDGETRSVTVRLLDYPQVYDRYSRVTVRLEGEDVPKLNAILYDNDRSLAEAEPGGWSFMGASALRPCPAPSWMPGTPPYIFTRFAMAWAREILRLSSKRGTGMKRG